MPTRLKGKKTATSRQIDKTNTTSINDISWSNDTAPVDATPAVAPARSHSISYHRPLLLSDPGASTALLSWFETVSESRSMPWRKEWIDPESFDGIDDELQVALTKRAYEVWVSEIMLQQTRVATVIPYFKNWISDWPTVEALSRADEDAVLAAWKGLGYYSRATRLHQGAQKIMAENAGRIPSSIEDLQKIPGIGRYTAGAISSIAFGKATPLLDGNVARVLSRHLGLYADAKEKKALDHLWKVADELVQHAAKHSMEESSDVPGKWNQALMELGSTLCTPRPKCEECPIRSTCRAYSEGEVFSLKSKISEAVPDIEECALCSPFELEDLEAATEDAEDDVVPTTTKKRKISVRSTNKISSYFTSNSARPSEENGSGKKRKAISIVQSASIRSYCSLFPKKAPKKNRAEEECIVCVIKSENGQAGSEAQWLIEQRPAKGLLASLWQFPTITLPPAKDSTARSRKLIAEEAASRLKIAGISPDDIEHEVELGTYTHVFSHLKLTMHVHCFALISPDKAEATHLTDGDILPKRKWVDMEALEQETLSTGMKRCWELVKGRSV